ncbi:uncharacterized protein LOC126101233 [Schistocerca cancellata]|uniref:uncharacterized protein LOC126101233 n=1 Tax=Schistocerca cancellata TaxID=274614 RepID=UPI002118E882|nr:uncharacterized protein LOC126101233 [Schistocerca cancellata]
MLRRLALLLVLELTVWDVASDGEPLVQKCCGRLQLLDAGHVCRRAGAAASQDDGGDSWWWLPNNSLSLNDSPTDTKAVTRALSGLRAVYNTTAPCGQESRLELVNLPGEDMDEFHLHIGHQQVRLEVLVPDLSPEGALVPAHSFCVDGVRVGSKLLHVAFACVCAGPAPCVRKCCRDYQAYDLTGGGSCVFVTEEEEDRDPSTGHWRPAPRDPEASRSYFLLRNRKPNCTVRSHRLQSNMDDFRLREDGNLLVRKPVCRTLVLSIHLAAT